MCECACVCAHVCVGVYVGVRVRVCVCVFGVGSIVPIHQLKKEPRTNNWFHTISCRQRTKQKVSAVSSIVSASTLATPPRQLQTPEIDYVGGALELSWDALLDVQVCVMLHVWMRHGACINRACHTYMDEACQTYGWDESHVWAQYVTCMNGEFHTYEWGISQLWKRRDTHTHVWITCINDVSSWDAVCVWHTATHTTTHCHTLQHKLQHTLQHTMMCRRGMWCVCDTLQHALPRTATHCNTNCNTHCNTQWCVVVGCGVCVTHCNTHYHALQHTATQIATHIATHNDVSSRDAVGLRYTATHTTTHCNALQQIIQRTL